MYENILLEEFLASLKRKKALDSAFLSLYIFRSFQYAYFFRRDTRMEKQIYIFNDFILSYTESLSRFCIESELSFNTLIISSLDKQKVLLEANFLQRDYAVLWFHVKDPNKIRFKLARIQNSYWYP